ncbi:MAG: uridine phosphorylase [Chloroflexi bacterium]|nr:uridine phosphorylase [Chloroflexota bacterium]
MEDEQGRQYHIQCREGDVGRYVLLPGDPGRCAVIANAFDEAWKVAEHREYVTYTGFLDGHKVSVTSTGIGAPSTAIAVEELSRIGADTFIRVGTSGAMQLDILPGDLVIATGAVRDEGTTIQYIPLAYPAVASHQVVSALIQAAERKKKRYHVGIVQSKDSFYGQHEPEAMPASDYLLSRWKAWLRGNVLASEMEAAAIFVLSSIKRLRSGCIVLAMANQELAKVQGKRVVVTDLSDLIEVAVESVRILAAWDDAREGKR